MLVMAPRSPTQAFDPTPALEHNSDNYSPLNDSFARKSIQENIDRLVKGVRFSEQPSFPTRKRHSIATTDVPLLPSVSSASRIPKQAFRITNPGHGIDITAYIENCRNLNEQLRSAHEAERKTWNIERSALQARIADLEFRLNKSQVTKRRSSNDSANTNSNALRTDFRNTPSFASVHTSRTRSEPSASALPPVWKGPDSTPPVTRVFSNEDDVKQLPSISEDEPLPALEKEISPRTVVEDSVPVSIGEVDKSLDGVTLKSSGLTSSFVRISSPTFISPARSPSPNTVVVFDEGGLKVDMNTLISPLDEKLKLNAGHTPMAFNGVLTSSANTTNHSTPKMENPPAPVPTSKRPALRPSENSDSYFSFVSDDTGEARDTTIADLDEPIPYLEATDDPALKGPLMLDSKAKSEAANVFLDKVDAKLMEAASRSARYSVSSAGTNDENTVNGGVQPPTIEEDAKPPVEKDDDMPALKFKTTASNFGSSWGGSQPGNL